MFSNAKYSRNTYVLIEQITLMLSIVPLVPAYRPRVIGGEEADIQQYQYVVSLQCDLSYANISSDRYSCCTGFLISSTWGLSAAHCFTDELKWIRYGDMTLPRNATTLYSKVLKMIPHPAYRRDLLLFYPKINSMLNDIGLMMVEEVPLTTFGVLSAVDYKSLLGLPVSYTGFGMTTYAIPHRVIYGYERRKKKRNMKNFFEDQHRPLQIGAGVVTSCDRLVGGPTLCVNAECNRFQSANFGDSGGPVFHDGKIVGVTTGTSLARIDHTNAPVSPYLEWIYGTIRQQF